MTQLAENRLVAEVDAIKISDSGYTAVVACFQVVETTNQSHWNRFHDEKRDYIRALRLYPAKPGTPKVTDTAEPGHLLDPADLVATALEHIDEIALANEMRITDDDHGLLRL